MYKLLRKAKEIKMNSLKIIRALNNDNFIKMIVMIESRKSL